MCLKVYMTVMANVMMVPEGRTCTQYDSCHYKKRKTEYGKVVQLLEHLQASVKILRSQNPHKYKVGMEAYL